MGERNLMLFKRKEDYISLEEIDILLEELRMYKILIDYARGLDDRGLRIFKSMIKRVYLLDIKNKDILLDTLNSIIYDIRVFIWKRIVCPVIC